MPGRSARIVEALRQGTAPDEIDPSIFDINSWQRQRRKLTEIKRRLLEADRAAWRISRRSSMPSTGLFRSSCNS